MKSAKPAVSATGCENRNGGAPRGTAVVVLSIASDHGQVTAISNGLVMGCIGLAMSTPVAVPLIL